MRSIENWQYTVHALNQRKGFYDYQAKINAVEELLDRVRNSPIHDYEPMPVEKVPTDISLGEYNALSDILADYKRAMHERKLLLVIGELCEAHEELRAGHEPREIYFSGEKSDKPEGVPIELADAQIRLWDLEQAMGIDGEYAVNLKHDYNETRPYKHGKQF